VTLLISLSYCENVPSSTITNIPFYYTLLNIVNGKNDCDHAILPPANLTNREYEETEMAELYNEQDEFVEIFSFKEKGFI
jgi:hypothetical protein